MFIYIYIVYKFDESVNKMFILGSSQQQQNVHKDMKSLKTKLLPFV